MLAVTVLVCLLLGAVAGVLAGLFGIGGGLVIVPVLAVLFKAWSFPEQSLLLMAVATSLASIIPTSLASVRAHHRLGVVVWARASRLTPGIVLGTGLGAILAENMPVAGLRWVLAGFLGYVSCQLAWQRQPVRNCLHPSRVHDYGMATLIGLLSAVVGIGGGTLTVPYLLRGGLAIPQAVAVSSACGLPIALTGTLSYAALGWSAPGLPEWSLGYVFLPAWLGLALGATTTAPLGAKWAHRLPAQQLKRYFSVLLFLMAGKMLWH